MTAQTWPFLGTDALHRGDVTPRTLLSRYDRVYRNVYVPKGSEISPAERAVAAWLWSGRQSTLAGLSAAAILGSKWIDPRLPAELYRRNGKPVEGILIHRDELLADELQVVRGISATTPARTAFDLGVAKDARWRSFGWMRWPMRRVYERRPSRRSSSGMPGLEGCDSCGRWSSYPTAGPNRRRTRTRLVLVAAGLPRPQTQIVVGDWRIDMGYEDFKVGVEYDGVQHWTDPRQHRGDIDRLAGLLARGWLIVRVSADLLRYRRDVIVDRTCRALLQAGAEWPVITHVLGDRVA